MSHRRAEIAKLKAVILAEDEKERQAGGARLVKKVPAEKVTEDLEKARQDLAAAKQRLKLVV